jgi:murein DD-endopeptidase MepM/ murein hydrolase activator NlpD
MMVRIAVDTGPGNGFVGELRKGRLRYELRRGGRVIAGGQFDLGRMLRAGILAVAALCLVSVLPPQPIPATAVSQPDAYVHVVPDALPAVPAVGALASLDSPVYEMGEHETLRRIADAIRVSVGCLEALNPGAAIEAGARLRLPKAGCEVVVFTAAGGERLADLADFWSAARVADRLGLSVETAMESAPLARTRDYSAWLTTGSPLRPVTLAGLVRDNAIPAGRPLFPGQVVYVQLTRPPSEVQVRLLDGSELYYAANMGLPVVGVLSQSYGGSGGTHRGIDIAAPLGTAIMCPRAGVVLFCGVDEDELALGNHIDLVHEFSPEALAYMATRFGVDDYADLSDADRRECLAGLQAMRAEGVRVSMLESLYGHIGGAAFGVSEGSIVGAWTRLARVGNNGNSTGSHLHWGVLVAEQSVPPLWFVPRAGGG